MRRPFWAPLGHPGSLARQRPGSSLAAIAGLQDAGAAAGSAVLATLAWRSIGGSATQTDMARSPQTLSEADRRIVAAWAADCAERVLGVFEAQAPGDDRPRALIARARAFSRAELNTAEEIRRRFVGGVSSREVQTPAAMAAARSAGQAVGVCHMGAHALGAAAYAAMAAGLADPERTEAVEDEVRWQLGHMSAAVRAALQTLPLVGEDSSGPLGPGLLSSGQVGIIIGRLQAGLSQTDPM